MYNKIRNPITNRKVSIYSRLGKHILRNYISMLGGGSSKFKEGTCTCGCNTPYCTKDGCGCGPGDKCTCGCADTDLSKNNRFGTDVDGVSWMNK